MWRAGLRVLEALGLEWRDLDYTGDPATLLVRRSKTRRARTVRLHPELVQLFTNWPANRAPRDKVVSLSMRTALRHIGAGSSPRAWVRSRLGLGIGAPALTAACSYTIDQSVFIESALGDVSAGEPAMSSPPDAPRPLAPRPFTPRPSLTGDYSVLPEVAVVLHESIEQDGPIPAAELPHFFFRFANFRNSDWFGFRSLRRLAEALTTVDPVLECGEPGEEWQMSLRDAPLEPAPAGSLEFDPPAESDEESDGLPALIETVHHLVGVPALDPDGFDLLFEHMAKLFDEGVTDRAVMSQLLQERVGDEGLTLPQDAAEFVTTGLWQSGFDVTSDASDPDVVAKAFRDYIVVRCEQAQRPLSGDELALVDEWLVGA